MTRLLTGLLLAAALAGTAAGAQPERVLAVEWQAGGGKLRWVSPTTLRPVGPSVLNVGGAPANVIATSPNGRTAAIGGGATGRVRFVRLEGLRQQALLELGGASVLAGLWPTADRLVVLLGHAPVEVVVLEPSTGRVLRREKIAGLTTGAIKAGNRLLTLLTPRGRIGPVHLAVVGADGSVRTVAIPGVSGGSAPSASPTRPSRFVSPGLAAQATRAVVLGRVNLVEVDVESLATSVRRLDVRTTAKSIEGWGRSAVWLRGNTIAASGWVASGGRRTTATGVRLVDVATGASRTLDARAAFVTKAGSTLLVHGNGPLRGFGLDGTLRYELLAGEETGYVQLAGGYAYVGSGNSTRFAVVDVRSGKLVGLARTAKPTVVLSP